MTRSTAAPHALVATGIEVIARNPGFALGYATSVREGVALPIGPDLTRRERSRTFMRPRNIKRVVPYVGSGLLVGIADGDRLHDKLAGRRTVIGASAIDMGVGDGAVAWAPHGSDSFASLFQLGGDPFPVESLRGVPLALEKGYAVTFRRGNAIWIGIATGENVLTPKRFSTIQGSGDKVGSPSITVSARRRHRCVGRSRRTEGTVGRSRRAIFSARCAATPSSHSHRLREAPV